MENTITIRRWDNDEVIFSYTCENNTTCKTVKEAIRQGISLAYTNLSHADLKGLDLSNVCLSHADLRNADLFLADLTNANLTDANLRCADLYGTKITNVDFTNVKGINDQCPKEGSFIAWKKCYSFNDKGIINNKYIVKLEIPADAKRSSSTGIKCRCDKAKVLEIQNLDGTKADIDEVYSIFDKNFSYKIGETVTSDWFDDKFWYECSDGIHFFMIRQNAVDYDFFKK